jgi:alanine racemase/UDP-N-acetylmuramoyl-tripeptide--D-alanyl-D-alanine ligase
MDTFDIRQWKLAARNGNNPLYIDDVSIDSRAIHTRHALFFALRGRRGDGHCFVADALRAGACFAIVEKEWQASAEIDEEQLIRVNSPLLALQDLARCYRASLPALQVVAVAGSCGKTMLKDLMGHLFKDSNAYTSPESFNSQLGVALSILNMPKNTSLAFIEMAATQHKEMERLVHIAQPEIALVTNFYRKRLGTAEIKQTTATEVMSLLKALPPSGFAIIEKDCSLDLSQISCPIFFWNAESPDLPIVRTIGIASPERLKVGGQFPDGSEAVFTIKGNHSYCIELLSLALKAAWKLQLPNAALIKALQTYQPETMRTEIWKNKSGTSFVNGTYCHTPLSFDASLDDLTAYTRSTAASKEGKSILIFGGLRNDKDPLSSSKRLIESIKNHTINEVYAWPQTVGDSLHNYSKGTIPVHSFNTLEEAITAAKSTISPSDVLIFKGPHKIPFDWLIEQIEESPPNTVACINLAAIRSNIELIRAQLKGNARIMVMVKALAYGTDDIRISHFLHTCGIDILGVSYVDEGVAMRKMGVRQSIFTINASENEMKKAAGWNIEVGVSSHPQIIAAIEAAKERNTILKIHLHVDTGMKRFGCSPVEALPLARAIDRSPYLKLEGIFTHFSVADDPSQDTFTIEQAHSLTTTIASLESQGISPTYRHACNSAAAIRFSFDQFNMVRIGLAAYGFHTSEATLSLLELRPALSLISRIVGFNDGAMGDTVSYGRTHVIKHLKARLAVLPIGYYDGIHRAYSEKGTVLIRGKPAPMVGRICMDYMMVDVTTIPEASVGDHALLFGEDECGAYLPPEKLAASGGSIVHELMTCLGPRVQRLFIYDESLLTR